MKGLQLGKVGRVHVHTLSRETSKGIRDDRRRGGRRRRETMDRDKWRRKQRTHVGISSRSKRTSAEIDLYLKQLFRFTFLTNYHYRYPSQSSLPFCGRRQ